MPWFVEHVRLCLRQKAEVMDALKVKLFGEEAGGGGGGGGCGSSKPPAAAASKSCTTSNSESTRRSPGSLEQPLPSTRDTALFKRLNSISGGSPGKDSASESAHKDADGVEAACKEEKADSLESEASQSEHDAARPPGRGGAEASDSPEGKARCAPSPDSPPKDADAESSASLKPSATRPEDGPVAETPAAEAESCKETRSEPGTEEGGAEQAEKMPVAEVRCIPPRIPSPMTDEENTSERSPSPPSDPSQSDDSKPPSPAPPSPSSPPKQDPPPPPPLPSPPQDMTQSVKRERDSDGEEEEEDVVKNHKRIKMEDAEDRHREEVEEEVILLKNKIKVEIPDEDGSMRGTPAPSPASESSGGSLPPERRVERNGKKASCGPQDASLDIIDPNCGQQPAKDSGSSALQAMESFIQRSFSSKFDSRRNAMSAGFGALSGGSHMIPMLNMSRGPPRSAVSPSPSPSTSSAASSMAYLSQFSRFLSPVQPSSSKYLDIGMDSLSPSLEKNVLSSLSAKSAELLEKTRNPIRDMTSMRSVTANGLSIKPSKAAKPKPAATTTSRTMDDDDKEMDSEDEREEKQDAAKEADKGSQEEDLATKYLNLDEEEKQEEKEEAEEAGPSPKAGSSSSNSGSSSKASSKKKSALDSLSSFVYGQPMTSEHPLDSLQKLLTKTSLPRVMSAAAGPFPHFSPHHYPPYLTEQMMERMCFTPPELPPASSSSSSSAMPLNLSLKPGGGAGGGGSSSEDEDPGSSHLDCESPTSAALRGEGEDGNHSSPGALGPDGELTEFKCAACSRRFASKGSYRYHLSRCHLSSVKKYGIKEAFNMSPYVYLPLDHTAKFTKYYQMAQELASKGK